MCTVTYYRHESEVIITSNRDEHLQRPFALFPRQYVYKEAELYFPKDPQGGGSWFVIKRKKSFVLLNGSNHRHAYNPPYRLSRGIILLDIAGSHNHAEAWQEIDLDNIEPFTLIVADQQALWQLQWDGETKSETLLDHFQPHIWSSATLYEPEIRRQRAGWFETFIQDHQPGLTAADLLYFHTHTHLEDTYSGLLIDRENAIRTQNVTQCSLQDTGIVLKHFDLIQQAESHLHLQDL